MPVFVSSLLTVVMLLLVAILYNVRCTRLVKPHEKTQQKEPEENDERFATGKLCGEVNLFAIVIMIEYRRHLLSWLIICISNYHFVDNRNF